MQLRVAAGPGDRRLLPRAALEAAEAAAHCTDPAVRQVLDQIARDETEHARLAWRFVHWALERAPERVRRAAEAAFSSEHELEAPGELALGEAAPGELDIALLRQGLVTEGLRAPLRRRSIAGAVLPCAEALFAELRRSRPSRVTSRRAGSTSSPQARYATS